MLLDPFELDEQALPPNPTPLQTAFFDPENDELSVAANKPAELYFEDPKLCAETVDPKKYPAINTAPNIVMKICFIFILLYIKFLYYTFFKANTTIDWARAATTIPIAAYIMAFLAELRV